MFTDDIQSDKLRRVLPAARRDHGDAARIRRATSWMRSRELTVYASADATVTVTAHDAGWVREHLASSAADAPSTTPLVAPLPFIAQPPPPRHVRGWEARSGMLFVGVAHTSAAQSMRWFLSQVHPLLLSRLRRTLNESDAVAQARLTIVGWGWKDLARFGPGCSGDSRVRGRLSRCVGEHGVFTADRYAAGAASHDAPPDGNGGGSAVTVSGGHPQLLPLAGEASSLVELRHAVDDDML